MAASSEGALYKAEPPAVETLDTPVLVMHSTPDLSMLYSPYFPRRNASNMVVVAVHFKTRAAGVLQALPTRAEVEAVCEENYAA
jgi:hypothetical protein